MWICFQYYMTSSVFWKWRLHFCVETKAFISYKKMMSHDTAVFIFSNTRNTVRYHVRSLYESLAVYRNQSTVIYWDKCRLIVLHSYITAFLSKNGASIFGKHWSDMIIHILKTFLVLKPVGGRPIALLPGEISLNCFWSSHFITYVCYLLCGNHFCL